MQQPTTMRGVLLTGHGGLDKLEYREDIKVPAPGPGDVLIRVGAAGVNNTDINTRIGWYSKRHQPGEADVAEDASWGGKALDLPRIQGIDVCGDIVAAGAGVDRARIGERVLVEPCLREAGGQPLDPPWYLGSECDGGFAEYLVVAARHAHRIDSPLSDVELASFPCSYSTAENLLHRAGLAAGERVLITGASGGVGSAAIQLAPAAADRRGADGVLGEAPRGEAGAQGCGGGLIRGRQSSCDLLAAPGPESIHSRSRRRAWSRRAPPAPWRRGYGRR